LIEYAERSPGEDGGDLELYEEEEENDEDGDETNDDEENEKEVEEDRKMNIGLDKVTSTLTTSNQTIKGINASLKRGNNVFPKNYQVQAPREGELHHFDFQKIIDLLRCICAC